MDINNIKNLILKKIPNAIIDIKEISNNTNHYEVKVISDIFIGKSLVQQHQIVLQSLKEKIGKSIHAINIKTHYVKKIKGI